MEELVYLAKVLVELGAQFIVTLEVVTQLLMVVAVEVEEVLVATAFTMVIQ